MASPHEEPVSVRARSHNAIFFLIATAILLITTNVLCRTQWKCSHYATVTASTPIQHIASKNKIAVAIRNKRTVKTSHKGDTQIDNHTHANENFLYFLVSRWSERCVQRSTAKRSVITPKYHHTHAGSLAHNILHMMCLSVLHLLHCLPQAVADKDFFPISTVPPSSTFENTCLESIQSVYHVKNCSNSIYGKDN